MKFPSAKGGRAERGRGESFFQMAGYTGNYRSALDDKGRLAIPAKLRKNGGERFYLSPGFGAYLVLYPEGEWEEITKNLSGQPFTKAVYRNFSRFLYSNTQEVTLDPQGRILIPENFLKEAGITKEAMVLGTGRWMEIWNPARHKVFNERFKPKWEKVAEKVLPGPSR